MAKKLLYILLLIASTIACEEVYIPDLKNIDNLLVVEAILISDKDQNYVYLYKSKNFNSESNSYPVVSGAKVKLVDDLGEIRNLTERSEGTYLLTGLLNTERSYYLSIEIGSDIYQSEVQTVPAIPHLDSIYGAFDSKTSTSGAVNSEKDVITNIGLQIFADITNTEDLNHYRFDGKRIIQFIDLFKTTMMGLPIELPIYSWRTYSLSGTFNIAGPPKYSAEKNIKKHRLEFFNQNYYQFIADTQSFAGWIYIIDQYGISEDAYNYYSDLNSQLEAQGKIFDPVYVQVKGNISCTNDQEKVVLGNFEIESHKEYRYFLQYGRKNGRFKIKEITHFYDIPNTGSIIDNRPDFWEY